MRERLDAHRPPCTHFGKFSEVDARAKGKTVSLKSAEQRIDTGSMHARSRSRRLRHGHRLCNKPVLLMPFLKQEAEA
jgi:hypothetical protein